MPTLAAVSVIINVILVAVAVTSITLSSIAYKGWTTSAPKNITTVPSGYTDAFVGFGVTSYPNCSDLVPTVDQQGAYLIHSLNHSLYIQKTPNNATAFSCIKADNLIQLNDQEAIYHTPELALVGAQADHQSYNEYWNTSVREFQVTTEDSTFTFMGFGVYYKAGVFYAGHYETDPLLTPNGFGFVSEKNVFSIVYTNNASSGTEVYYNPMITFDNTNQSASRLQVWWPTTFWSNVRIGGSTTFIQGAIFSNGLSVDNGLATFNGGIAVLGGTSTFTMVFADGLTVNGPSTFVNATATTLTVANVSTFNGALYSNTNLTVGGVFTVKVGTVININSDTILNGSISVNGVGTFNQPVTFNGGGTFIQHAAFNDYTAFYGDVKLWNPVYFYAQMNHNYGSNKDKGSSLINGDLVKLNGKILVSEDVNPSLTVPLYLYTGSNATLYLQRTGSRVMLELCTAQGPVALSYSIGLLSVYDTTTSLPL